MVGTGKTVEQEPWDPAEFMKDAQYFAATFGLPNEGLNPFKITDVTDQMLVAVFGEKSRNGYKLASCVGLPVEDMLELSQVVDGYDKPINGVLSHSFVKGVYAERVQRRKVNWAVYASAKLKGQITQREREKKGKPVGPPYIRRARQYRPPQPPQAEEDGHEVLDQPKVEESIEPRQALVVRGELPVGNVGREGSNDDFESSLARPVKESRWTSRPLGEKPHGNVLLAVLESSMAATATEERQLCQQITKVKATLEALHKAEADLPKLKDQLQQDVNKSQAEFVDLGKQIDSKEADICSLTSDIELEQNKEDTDEGVDEFLSTLEFRLDKCQVDLENLHSRRETVARELHTYGGILSAKEKSFEDLSKKEARASNLLVGLEKDLKVVQLARECQRKEYEILAAVLETPSPVLVPRFVPTSTRTVGTHISLTNCPVCCNGYHCYNWVPASCGHVYHAACLFPMIASSSCDPKCHSCGETFSHDWLRSWGLEQAGSCSILTQTKGYVDEIRDVYGKYSGRLVRRRELAAQIQSVQERGDGVTRSESPYHSFVEGLDFQIEDDVERGSSKIPLLTPKTETPGKKRKADGKAEGEDSRKVNHSLLSSPELRTLHFTPECISTVHFRHLYEVVGTSSSNPVKTGTQQGGVAQGVRKKSKKKLTLLG